MLKAGIEHIRRRSPDIFALLLAIFIGMCIGGKMIYSNQQNDLKKVWNTCGEDQSCYQISVALQLGKPLDPPDTKKPTGK